MTFGTAYVCRPMELVAGSLSILIPIRMSVIFITYV
jgi:hypothetical protein